MLGYFLLALVNLSIAHNDTLKLINIVFRHGQRTPASTYPSDPYKNEKFAPYGWGQLTNLGRLQQYNQGKWLKERYKHFLGSKYTSDLLEAITTDVERTKMSCALMFAGLLPPVDEQIWNENLLWQPIPSQHQKLAEDKLLLVRGCPRYSEALDEVLRTEEVRGMIESHQDLYKYLTKHAGVEVKDPWGVEDIFSTLRAEEDYNLELPKWTDKVYPKEMQEITELSFLLNVWNNELKRIKGGPLLKKIINSMKDKAEEKLPNVRKLYVYAGHDSTVANLLSALNVWDKQLPVYNIMAIIELHKMTDEFRVKIFLRNNTETLQELRVPGCVDHPCPLEELIKLTANVIPDSINSICKTKNDNFSSPTDSAP